jgi:DNA polymerase III psi subunit
MRQHSVFCYNSFLNKSIKVSCVILLGFAKVAQLAEQSLRKRWVVGSNPTFGSYAHLHISEPAIGFKPIREA